MNRTLIASLLACWSYSSYATSLYQFETGLPESFTASNKDSLSISNEVNKDGDYSIKWHVNPGDSLSIKGDVGYVNFDDNSKEKARSSFALWIYSPTLMDGELLVQFKKQGQIKSWFPIKVNFTGWRTVWVQFDRDMQGIPEEGMDEIVMTANNLNGTLFMDQIIPSVFIDPRHNVRDKQVDFVNIPADTSVNTHWMSLFKNNQLIPKHFNSKTSIDGYIEHIDNIENRVRNTLLKKIEVTPDKIASQRVKLDRFKTTSLEYPKRMVIYKSFSSNEKEHLNTTQMRAFGQFVRQLSYMYYSTDNTQYKTDIFNIFEDSLQYLYDQGWDNGSGQGTISHLGYQVRELYEGIFLMKVPLSQSGGLQQAKDMVTWYSAVGMIYTDISTMRGINLDILNTMLPGMLFAILLNENKQIESEQLAQLKSYLTQAITYSPGVLGGFKSDGSVFHHMQNYPAYAKGAFSGLTPIIYYLSQTPYAIDGQAYDLVKNALLMSRIFSNKTNYLLTLTGRHPNDKFAIDSSGFKYTALGGQKTVDADLAKAYLRLDPKGDKAAYFTQQGFQAESAPNGSWTMNMSSLQLHRRGEWLVGVKGYSRYLVGNESYEKNNLFGRYMSYGSFQILQNSLEESGFVQEGWSWAHYPGTTSIALPIETLKSSISQVDIHSGVEEMLLSDETYSGGNSLNNNGMFAMKLHEHPKYNGSHRARKSVFIFDNRAVLLGTGIENNDEHNETHTTLFQNVLKDNTFVEQKSSTKHQILEDSYNNIYNIKQGAIVLRSGPQESRDQNTGLKTSNNYELAYINHGTAPKSDRYEYSILIKGTDSEKQTFIDNANYRVIKQDNDSHIVEDSVSKMRGYALFEPQQLDNDTFIREIDTPSLVLLHETTDHLKLSFVDPDLRLYEGTDSSQYDKNGMMKEVSIYSRKWKANDSNLHTSRLVLNGKYELISGDNTKVEVNDDITVLYISTQYAKPIEIALKNIDKIS